MSDAEVTHGILCWVYWWGSEAEVQPNFLLLLLSFTKIDILFLNVLKKSHKRQIKMHNFNDQLLLEITR